MALPDIEVDVGSNQNVIMYGPTIFANLRIHADTERGEWVIERQRIATNEWREAFAVPCPIDEEFTFDEDDTREPESM